MLQQAAALLAEGEYLEAESLLRPYVFENPLDVSGIRMLAEVGLHVGAYGDAEKLLVRCLELAPDFDLARLNFAALLSKRHRYTEALSEIDTLLARDAENPAYLVQKASILIGIGQFDEAIAIYRALAARLSTQPALFMSLGHALKTIGRQDEAIEAYRQAIQVAPGFGEAYWSLANLKTFRFEDSDLETMQQAMQAGGIKAHDFFHLCFACGAALEARGDHDGAFEAYARGNHVKRNLVRYDARENYTETKGLREFFRSDYFASVKDQGHDDPAPIFVVGLPRAGSTLLEQILSSHSQIEGTMELPDIISIARRLSGKRKATDESRYPAALAELSPEDLRELGQDYIERTRVHRTGLPFFIDKMPNNFSHIGLIHTILPKARIIDARRHPMACGFSVFKQLFAKGQNFSYSLNDIGNYYRDYLDLMDHWDDVIPGAVHRVQYETLLENFEAEVRRLFIYLGLPFEEQCLEFHKTDRAVRTASSEQVRQPIYKSARDHWQNFETHLAPLKKALGPALNRFQA